MCARIWISTYVNVSVYVNICIWNIVTPRHLHIHNMFMSYFWCCQVAVYKNTSVYCLYVCKTYHLNQNRHVYQSHYIFVLICKVIIYKILFHSNDNTSWMLQLKWFILFLYWNLEVKHQKAANTFIWSSMIELYQNWLTCIYCLLLIFSIANVMNFKFKSLIASWFICWNKLSRFCQM